jgi:predicted transcriptional regulator
MIIPTPLDIEIMALKAGKAMRVICKEAGVSHSSFSRWKCGHSEMQPRTIRKLLDVLEPKEAAE